VTTVEIRVDGKVEAKYSKLPEDIRGSLRAAIPDLTRQLADRVREKLAPGNLFKTTTRLLPAVTAKMIENTSEIYGRVYIDSNKFPEVVAATLESGSVPHVIAAKNANALFFFWEKLGQNVMFKSVHHPGFEGRSYMQSSLDEMKPVLVEGLRRAILGPINA
jgi:hypothetical protein